MNLIVEQLTAELLDGCPSEQRCPHLRITPDGIPFCGQDGVTVPTVERFLVCDNASLQLWCLDKERALKCIFYNGIQKFIPEDELCL